MKKVVLTFIIFSFLAGNGFASIAIQDGLDILRYMELQVMAVDVDVMLPLGWSEGDKKAIKIAADRAIQKLADLRSSLANLNISADLEIVRKYQLESIDRLKNLYADLDKKGEDKIAKGYAEIRALAETQSRDLNAIYEKYLPGDKLPANIDQIQEETRFALSKDDANAYLAATKLISEQKYKEAAGILAKLEPKYKGAPFGICISFRISDVLLRADESAMDLERGEKILNGIVDGKQYSPVLSEAFEKWRAFTQSFYHGMSNMSEIPNDAYNQKRWELVQVIKEYQQRNPNDSWARTQVNALLAVPNIGRGGPYGNDNLMYYGKLYMSEPSADK